MSEQANHTSQAWKASSPAAPLITQQPQVPQTFSPARDSAREIFPGTSPNRQTVVAAACLESGNPTACAHHVPLNKGGDVSVAGVGTPASSPTAHVAR